MPTREEKENKIRKEESSFLGRKTSKSKDFDSAQKFQKISDTSEKEEKIKREACEILDKFAKALENIKEIPDSFVEREEDRRKESEKGQEPDSDFRKIFFENAPSTKKECIEAEKGGWK